MLYKCIVIYFIIMLLYFRIHNIKNNRLEKIILSIFIPIFGFLAVVLSEGREKQIKKESKVEKKKDDKEKEKEYLTNIQSSLLDNLVIQDYEQAREMILSTKSLKLEEQCKICHIAIKSKNVEISHIAAVSLMRIQGYFEKLFAHMENRVNLEKIDNLKKYIDSMNRYLKCELAQGALRKKYIKKLISEIEKLIQMDEKCEKRYYVILIESCIKDKKYDKAIQYSKKRIEMYGMDEEIYKLILNICICTKDVKKLNEILGKINSNSEIACKLASNINLWK